MFVKYLFFTSIMLFCVVFGSAMRVFPGENVYERPEKTYLDKNTEIICFYNEENQLVQTGFVTNGRPDGIWRRYYDDGSIHMEGLFYKGKKVGSWKVYDKNNMIYIIEYKDDVIVSSYAVN